MPPGFLRLRRGLSAVILVRGLLPGAFFGGEAFVPLMLVEERGIALRAGRRGADGRRDRLDHRLLAAVPDLAARPPRSADHARLRVGWRSASRSSALTALVAARCGSASSGSAGSSPGWAWDWRSPVRPSRSCRCPPEGEQGRNASSLNLFDALGSGIFVGLAGTLFAALHPHREPAADLRRTAAQHERRRSPGRLRLAPDRCDPAGRLATRPRRPPVVPRSRKLGANDNDTPRGVVVCAHFPREGDEDETRQFPGGGLS